MPEAIFWKFLRDRRMEDFKFRRQMPIGPYIADFACPSIRLIVELDGGVHDLRVEQDAVRDAWLSANGWTVIRFRNQAVLINPALLFQACGIMQRSEAAFLLPLRENRRSHHTVFAV